MTTPRTRRTLPVIACLIASACARVSVDQPERPGQDLAVLLPDSHDGTVGRATVSNAYGATELSDARAATRISPGQAPTPVETLPEADVQRRFGDALAALPPAPQAFTLNFLFNSEDLTPASSALLADTLQAVKRRPVPDILVVGHTDTTGPPSLNFQLALRRAQTVRALLLAAGLDAGAVDVASHGEAQPLVLTPDETNEPRNRRVVITVR